MDSCGVYSAINGATEIVRTDMARPSKLRGLTSQDWTTWDHHHTARPDNTAPDRRGGQCETWQCETISQGWTSRDLNMWHQIKQVYNFRILLFLRPAISCLHFHVDQTLDTQERTWFVCCWACLISFLVDGCSTSRVRTILVLGNWVLGNIQRYWVVSVLGRYFLLFWHPIQYQSDSSQHRPHASERLFHSACDFYSDRRSHLSGHHADMLLFIKHNHCHHHRVLGLFVVTAILCTSISIGIGYWYR